MKRHVKDLINQRGLKDFATVRPDDSISDALNVLLATNCSAVARTGVERDDQEQQIAA